MIKKLGQMQMWKHKHIRRFIRLAKFEHGFSVVELLVASSIEAIAISVMLFYFSSLQTHAIKTSFYSMGQREAMLAMQKMVRDLRETSTSTVNIDTNFISFASPRDAARNFITDANGQPVWKKAIFYYIPSGTTKLCRHEVAKEDWTTKATAADIPGTPPWEISKEISSLQLSLMPDNLAKITIKQLKNLVNSSSTQTAEIATRVALQN